MCFEDIQIYWFQLCILFCSLIIFYEPINSNLCSTYTLGYLFIPWRVVNLPVVTSLKKIYSLCFLVGTNCQFILTSGQDFMSLSVQDLGMLSQAVQFQPLCWYEKHCFTVASHYPWHLRNLVFLKFNKFTLSPLTNNVMNNFIVGASQYSYGFN